jgi:hypothetical protein
VDYTTEKGEKMKKKSKGNLLDFTKDASKINSPMRKEFLDKLYMDGVTAEDLLKLFHRWSYDGVSLEDCTKLLSIVRTRGPFPCKFNEKY